MSSGKQLNTINTKKNIIIISGPFSIRKSKVMGTYSQLSSTRVHWCIHDIPGGLILSSCLQRVSNCASAMSSASVDVIIGLFPFGLSAVSRFPAVSCFPGNLEMFSVFTVNPAHCFGLFPGIHNATQGVNSNNDIFTCISLDR